MKLKQVELFEAVTLPGITNGADQSMYEVKQPGISLELDGNGYLHIRRNNKYAIVGPNNIKSAIPMPEEKVEAPPAKSKVKNVQD